MKIPRITVLAIFLSALFLGVLLLLIGYYGKNGILIFIGIVVSCAALIFHLIFHRCPHCKHFVDNILSEHCPYCGEFLN